MDTVSAEHRDVRRARTLLGAKVIFNGGHSVLDCLVRNLSPSGARLQLENALSPPEAFELAISDGRTFRCALVWRQPGFVGVKFETAN